jgi:hypothetical protein
VPIPEMIILFEKISSLKKTEVVNRVLVKKNSLQKNFKEPYKEFRLANKKIINIMKHSK